MIGVHRSLEHMAWANQRVFAAVCELPWSALGSYVVNEEWIAGRIMHHMVSGATWYLYCLGIEAEREIPIPSNMDEMRALAVMLAEFDAKILTAADLDDERLEFKTDTGSGRVLRSTLLAQAAHHASEHRAQLIDALEARGHHPIALDEVDLWCFEYFQRKSGRPQE